MNGETNENQLTIVEEYEFDKPLIHKIDCIIDNYLRGCHKKYFHTFEYKCVYDIKLTNIGNDEIVKLTIADKSMNLYELKEKLQIARENGYKFNEITKLKRN